MSRPDYTRRHFSRETKREAFDRAAGRCECHLVPNLPFCCGGAPLYVGRIIYEHIDPWKISRDSSPENCAVLRTECASRKTNEIDLPLIASVDRIRDRHIGALTSRHPMPAGRRSKWTKPIGAFRPVRRVSQADKLRAALDRRYAAFIAGEVQS
jgi:hypothetical protein